MKNTVLTCIGCPMGCQISVFCDENWSIVSVEGNSCLLGKKYAVSEVTSPKRILTSSVAVLDGDMPVCCVKTSSPVDKSRVLEYAKLLNTVIVKAPVGIGDVVISDIGGSGVDVIATRNIRRVK